MSRELDFYNLVAPSIINKRATRVAVLAHCSALQEAKNFPSFERDAIPYFRSLNSRCGLMDATWGRGVTVQAVPHQGGHHAEVSGKGFVVTSVTRSRMPRKVATHEYRATLARDAQLSLFDPNLPPETGFIYGLLVFGGTPKSVLPEFCRMTFPTEDGLLAPGTINLLAECASVVEPFRDEEYREREVAKFIAARAASAA